MSQFATITGLRKTFLEHGEIHIDGDVDEAMAEYVHECFLHLRAAGSPDVKIFIRSNGGEVPCGFHIYDEIRHYAGNTRGIVNGFAYSMAALVLQGCVERLAYPHATFLVHIVRLSGDITEDQLTKKGADMLRRELRATTLQAHKILEVHTGLTSLEIKNLMALNKVLTAKEAHKVGLFDDFC
ncbi:MAG: ATP-dependent Clp protease proteolytic subunit [Patescibacteria group bacterium]|nr:ATP-dependent Clp protease proteolytic subunit [Patescibacteria group bacterium]